MYSTLHQLQKVFEAVTNLQEQKEKDLLFNKDGLALHFQKKVARHGRNRFVLLIKNFIKTRKSFHLGNKQQRYTNLSLLLSAFTLYP